MSEERSPHQRRPKPPLKEDQISNLLRLGILAADVGRRADARACFAAVLAMDSNNAQALLWQAGLADDPRESLAYLARVLTINPRNEYAKAGIRWARKRATRFEQAGRRGQGPRFSAFWRFWWVVGWPSLEAMTSRPSGLHCCLPLRLLKPSLLPCARPLPPQPRIRRRPR